MALFACKGILCKMSNRIYNNLGKSIITSGKILQLIDTETNNTISPSCWNMQDFIQLFGISVT